MPAINGIITIKPENQDNQNNQGQNKDNQQQEDQNQEQNQDQNQKDNSDKEQQGNNEQQSQSGISPQEREALWEAIQAQEDKTQEKLDEKKKGIIIRGKKNW